MLRGTFGRFPLRLALGIACLASTATTLGADWLEPREIPVDRVNVAPELVEDTRGSQIERGGRRPVLDGVGWVFGIPSKIILWDRRVDNHAVSAETEEAIRRYVADNDLDHVKIRINQYAPLDDWRRLRANTTVGWGYRYTLGALSVAQEAILPGRLFGGDHYNPFTGTIHLYSDVPAIALHEGGHAKDFTRRNYPGTYALAAGLPIVSLWPEAIATGDAIAYAEEHRDPDLERESYRILYPAYGTCVAGALRPFAAPVALPVFAGVVVAGHAVGRVQAHMVPDAARDTASNTALAAAEMAPLPGIHVAHEEAISPEPADATADASSHGDGEPWRLAWWPFGRR
jgi:hypothetical protein